MSLPGRSLASAMRSLTDLTGRLGATASTPLVVPICVTPAKSLTGSYARSLCRTAPIANDAEIRESV